MRDVEPRAEGRGREHGDDGHAVHVVGDGFPGCDAETAPAFALCGFEALEEVQEGEGGGGLGGRLWGGDLGEGCWVVSIRWIGLLKWGRWGSVWLPDWRVHGFSIVAAVCGALETASRILLDSEPTFEVAVSGGESGVVMIGLLNLFPN